MAARRAKPRPIPKRLAGGPEKLTAAIQRGKDVGLPTGVPVHVLERTTPVARASFPGLPGELPSAVPQVQIDAATGALYTKKRGRGRPPAARPSGAWSVDAGLLLEVQKVVEGRDSRERDEHGGTVYEGAAKLDALDQLKRRIVGVLPEDKARKQRMRLRALLFGKSRDRRRADVKNPKYRDLTKAKRASDIWHQIIAWRDGVPFRDVRRRINALKTRDEVEAIHR